MLVYFSGFKDQTPPYTNAFKDELGAMVKKLGGDVRTDAEFDSKITHVVRLLIIAFCVGCLLIARCRSLRSTVVP